MRHDPTLIIKRLIVERNEAIVYDEKFHEGVNVIRGENSSGKSTVLNFIFFGLGGDLTDWSTVARLCTRVTVEVRVNGNHATLSRQISEKSGQPMDIFGGPYEAARKAPRSEWIRYPYRNTENRESFSKALFRLLGIPEVASDISGNITVHQLLRLLYADQLSPIEDLFRFERFDQTILRDTVGRLLCGAYDSIVYDNEQKIRSLLKEHDTINGELRSLFAVLGKAEHNFTIEWITGERKVLNERREALQKEIEDAERAIYNTSAADRITLEAQDASYSQTQKLQVELGIARKNLDAIILAQADSEEFVIGLQQKLDALRDSARVADHFGEVRFQTCPACYAPIDDEVSSHACHLCKTPFESERARERIVALINDTALQIRQSQQLLKVRDVRAKEANQLIESLHSQWRQASRQLAALQRLPSTDARVQLRKLHSSAGYLERQIEDLEQKAHIIKLIDQIATKKEDISSMIGRLRSENESLLASQQRRLSMAYTAIADEIRTLLHNDLRRQDIFEDPEIVSFNFVDNKITVDGESYFSASSRAILKSSFCLGFLAAAMKIPFFRHPRFCMIDTIENMGVEPIRSHNFQLQIARISSETDVEHQVIYATAMIAPDLDDERFTVGKFSTRDDPTIAIEL